MSDKRFNETTSKREMFAAMALQGLMANSAIARIPKGNTKGNTDPVVLAADAVIYADALLEELERNQ